MRGKNYTKGEEGFGGNYEKVAQRTFTFTFFALKNNK